ncbi:MAG TPA: hypothetical protein VNN09_03230 [Candidatus Competibacteraceae bacterium]|nr:hypothetical protein [Candidatus Competibacteraceae bacterium]
MLNRRHFLLGCTGFWVILPLSGTSAAEKRKSSTAHPLPGADIDLSSDLSRAKFATLLGETFEVYGGTGLVLVNQLRLHEIVDQEVSTPEVEQFNLRFTAALDTRLPAAVYTMRHALAGQTTLRLEPDGEDGQQRYYRAVFALLR